MTMQEFHALMKSDRSVAIAFSEDPVARLGWLGQVGKLQNYVYIAIYIYILVYS